MKTFNYNPSVGDEAIAAIIANPEEWDQETWVCGTIGCLAGRVTLQDGWRSTKNRSLASSEVQKHIDGVLEIRDVSDLAQELLGLNKYRAQLLFSSANQMSVLQGMLKHFADHPVSYEITWNYDPSAEELFQKTEVSNGDLAEYNRLIREALLQK